MESPDPSFQEKEPSWPRPDDYAAGEDPPYDFEQRYAAIEQPGCKLHSPGHVALATFLGGPFAGTVVLALNYFKIGRKLAGIHVMSLGLLGTTLLLIVAFKLPEQFPSALVSLPALLGTYLLAKGLQGSLVDRHLEAGGKKASAWSAAAIGLLGCVLLFGGGVAWFFIDDQFFVQRVTFGADEEVIYEDGATEADARKIGIYLQTIGYFNGKGAKSVRVTCPRGRPRVEFVLQKAAANDPEIVTFFRNIQPNLSNDVFGGRPVEVQLVDEWWTVQRTLN